MINMLLKGMNMLLNDEYVVPGISHVPSFTLTFFLIFKIHMWLCFFKFLSFLLFSFSFWMFFFNLF